MTTPTDALIELWKILQPEPGEDLLEAARRIKHAYPYQPANAKEGISIEDRQAEGNEPSVNAPSSPAPGDSGQAQGPVTDTWVDVWLGEGSTTRVARTLYSFQTLDRIEDEGYARKRYLFMGPGGAEVRVRGDMVIGAFVSSPESRAAQRAITFLVEDEAASQAREDDEDDGDDDIWKKGYVPAG